MPQSQVADSSSTRSEHERWLLEVTSLVTAAGYEDAVLAWIARWVAARPHLKLRRDPAGNLFVARARRPRSLGRRRPASPLFITAHLDHPAFVVVEARGPEVVLEFRGGVHDPYFEGARIEIRSRTGAIHRASLLSVDPAARPLKRVVARSESVTNGIAAGDLARWRFDGENVPRVIDGILYAHACDDLAGVVAALAMMDGLGQAADAAVGLLFTRAEEVGFLGAIAACQSKSVPVGSRLICLETSRSFAESPVGGGPIVRVGDRTSVFDPGLTNAISTLMAEHEQAHPGFRWQRKLMPGGTCEATTFGAYGYQSTCLCLPLGNYHNMVDIDDVLAGHRPARVGPEFISLDDFHGLVEMLRVCATRLDGGTPSLRERMESLMTTHGEVLGRLTQRGAVGRRPSARRRSSRRRTSPARARRR